jgi:hypothetical protein
LLFRPLQFFSSRSGNAWLSGGAPHPLGATCAGSRKIGEQRQPARCQRTSVSGRMIVMILRTDGNQRFQLDEEQAIAVRELDPTADLPLQHDQLLPERGILGLKSAPGFEERSNQVQE